MRELDAVAARGAEDGFALRRFDLAAIEREAHELCVILCGFGERHVRAALRDRVAHGRTLLVVAVAQGLCAVGVAAHWLTAFLDCDVFFILQSSIRLVLRSPRSGRLEGRPQATSPSLHPSRRRCAPPQDEVRGCAQNSSS